MKSCSILHLPKVKSFMVILLLWAAGEIGDGVAPFFGREFPRVQVLDLVEGLLVVARVQAQIRQVFTANLLPKGVEQVVAG